MISTEERAVPVGDAPADLGVLGGMGPQATHYFTDELLTAIEASHHPQKDQDYPSIVVRYACHIPDRTASLTTDRRRQLAEAVIREARALVGLGCIQILMPCITAHCLLDSELCGFPFVDIRKVVANRIAELFPGARVGILATRGARVSGAIDKFVSGANEAVKLNGQDEEQVMDFIYRQAKTSAGGKDISPLRDLADKLRRRGCDVIVAGCTEVEMCLARYGTEKEGFVFPLRTAAQVWAATWQKK